jgi:hypothetical protein
MLGGNTASSKKGAFLWFKEIYSTCLLIFCSIIVLTVIFEENTTISQFSAWAAFFIFWIALYWLSMVEGGQVSYSKYFSIISLLFLLKVCLRTLSSSSSSFL